MKKRVLSIVLAGFMICQSITAYGAEFTDSTEIEYEQNEETNMEDDIVQDNTENDDFTDGQPNAEQESDVAIFEDAEADDVNSEILIDDNDEDAYSATADELTSGDYKYVVSENEATITRYTGTESYVRIPEKIDGYTVRMVGKYAFGSCARLEKIEIPDSVTEIGEEAFKECRNLKEVSGGRKLQKFESWVFYNCENLEKITLSSTLTEIGWSIFAGCKRLKTAGPESGEYNIKIGFSGNIPDTPFANSDLESIVIPSKTTSIKESEYRYCSYLKEVQIPSGVKTIGKSAFGSCTRLEKIEIPDSVTEIGEEAFKECSNLKEVSGGRKLQKFGSWVFYNCENLEKITLSSTLTEIGWSIFAGCKKVTIYGYDGSEAQTYAQKNNIPFVILKDDPSSFDISNATISGLKKSYEHTGKAIQPTLKVILQSKTLTLNKDYKISYKNNKKVGTATITIKGIGKYTGTQTAQFQIAITPNLDNLKTSYTVEAGKTKKANTIKIAANGNLIVEGKLYAKEIYINKGGKLTIKANGMVQSDSVISQGGVTSGGGVLENTGLLKTQTLTVKNAGTVIMDDSAQTIVYDNFTMSTQSSKSSLKKGELFINGSFTLNGNSKNFVVEDNSDFKTIFCNAKDNKLVTKSRKYNLGTVCVANQKAYENLDLKAENYNSTVIYTKLKKDDQKRWTYTLSGKTLSIGASEWGVLIGRLYEQASENSAYTVTNSSLTVTERKFVESVASVWVNTIQTPINKGLNENSSTKCQMAFKVGKHTCTLTCNMDKYGSYAVNGHVKLKVDNEKEQTIGMIAAGSIENFKAQAAVYLTEGYIKEYYKFTTGKVLKNITSKTNSAKLAGKFLEKIIDKYCFQSLKTSGTDEVDKIKKVFKIAEYFGKAV